MAAAQKKITPLGGHILVKPIQEDQKTDSGIIIPDTAEKEKPQKGTIIALGTGKLSKGGNKIPFTVKVKDTVLFKKYSPEEIEVDGETLLILEESDILAILK